MCPERPGRGAGWHRLALLAATLALGGCTALGPEFSRPEAPVAAGFAGAGDADIDAESADYRAWWTVFEDPVLDGLIETAYQQNLSLRIAGVRILEARAQLGVAVGRQYPQEQAGRLGVTYNDVSEGRANTAVGDLNFWDFDVGFDTFWELDFWGKFRRGIEAADANLLASVATYDDILVSLTAEVARVYVVIRTFEERLEIARQNVAIQERSLQIADVRFRNGLTTELDVQQAETLLSQTRALIPQLETGLRQAKNALATLLGIPANELRMVVKEPGVIPSAPADLAVGAPAELLRRRPDVRRAELDAAAQSALIGVAEADLFPSFALFGTIGFAASAGTDTTRLGSSGVDELFKGESLEFLGGPSVSWNLFNYGRIKNNVRVQDARLEQLMVNYQDTVLRAAQEVEDAIVGFTKAKERVGFLETGVAAAERSVELALIQYRDGTIDYTRVLDTQGALSAQQDDLTATRGDISTNLVAAYKALGGGWELRMGQAFVPGDTREAMRSRTDWGELLDDTSEKEGFEGSKTYWMKYWRVPDW